MTEETLEAVRNGRDAYKAMADQWWCDSITAGSEIQKLRTQNAILLGQIDRHGETIRSLRSTIDALFGNAAEVADILRPYAGLTDYLDATRDDWKMPDGWQHPEPQSFADVLRTVTSAYDPGAVASPELGVGAIDGNEIDRETAEENML